MCLFIQNSLGGKVAQSAFSDFKLKLYIALFEIPPEIFPYTTSYLQIIHHRLCLWHCFDILTSIAFNFTLKVSLNHI